MSNKILGQGRVEKLADEAEKQPMVGLSEQELVHVQSGDLHQGRSRPALGADQGRTPRAPCRGPVWSPRAGVCSALGEGGWLVSITDLPLASTSSRRELLSISPRSS